MAKIVLDDVSNTPNMFVGVNKNSATIETAFENTLSRDGTGPNHMQADLNMNGYNILNQGNPVVVEGIEWQGDWNPSFSYKVGDIVTHTTGTYICVVAHVSGDFPTDLINNKWQLFVPPPDIYLGDLDYTYTTGVERTLQERLEDYISITDFGAVGDGVTNNFQAITDTIAAANGKKIYVPVDSAGGDYAITSGSLTLTGVFEYESGARIYASGGTVTDNSRFIGFGGEVGEGLSRYTRGLNAQLLGTMAGAISVAQAIHHYMRVEGDVLDVTTGGGSKSTGFLVDHRFGGTGAKGGRQGIASRLIQDGVTEATNTDRNYTGTIGQVLTATGDGGSLGAELGGYFGMNGFAMAQAGALHTLNVTAAEFDVLVNTGASTKYRSGIQVCSGGNERGTTWDAGIAISSFGATNPKFESAILVGPMNGVDGLGSDSTVLKVINTTIIKDVIKVTSPVGGALFSYAPTSGGGVLLSTINLSIDATNAGIDLGRLGASNIPHIDFHSGNAGSPDYDARISGTGGTSSNGGGTLNYTAATHSFNGNVTVTGSLNVSDKSTTRTNLGLGSIATRNITVSTSDPSGGADGDLWFKYTA